jgi:hypothetical protein
MMVISDPKRAESLICILREGMKRQRELGAELNTIGYDIISINSGLNEIRSDLVFQKERLFIDVE